MSLIQSIPLLCCFMLVSSAAIVRMRFEDLGDINGEEYDGRFEQGPGLEESSGGCVIDGKSYRDGATFVSNGNFLKQCHVVDLGFHTEIVACLLPQSKKTLRVNTSLKLDKFKYTCKKDAQGTVTLQAKFLGL